MPIHATVLYVKRYQRKFVLSDGADAGGHQATPGTTDTGADDGSDAAAGPDDLNPTGKGDAPGDTVTSDPEFGLDVQTIINLDAATAAAPGEVPTKGTGRGEPRVSPSSPLQHTDGK